MARVLIHCPTFDHAETLVASTASVRTQAFRDWELVVVGDGAPDRTATIMAAIGRADARIRYEPRPGQSDAYMWAKFFRLPSLAMASTAATTAIKFPSHVAGRKDLDSRERLAELMPWLARMAEPGFVRRVCAAASVRSRLLTLYQMHDVSGATSPTEALRLCGFEPAPAHERPATARDGSLMVLPLSPGQRHEADLALEDYHRLRRS